MGTRSGRSGGGTSSSSSVPRTSAASRTTAVWKMPVSISSLKCSVPVFSMKST